MRWTIPRDLEPTWLTDRVGEQKRYDSLWHGVTLISGPTGSGKTLLAVMFIYSYAMKPSFRCLGRSCNDSKCRKEWTIYTNSKTLTGDGWKRKSGKHKGESVIKDIDDILPMLQSKTPIDHAIFFVDEVQEWIDNRTSMSRDNREVGYIIAQMRKMTTKAYLTTPNINTIDRRVREMAKRTFSCWNPDKHGMKVHALVRELNVGHLAPWKRDQMDKDSHREYFTGPYRHLYQTHEQIDPPRFFSPTERVNIVQRDENGEKHLVTTTYKSIIEDGLIKPLLLTDPPVTSVSAAPLLVDLKATFGIDWDEGKLRSTMRALGYFDDSEGVFEIGVDNTQTVDLDEVAA